jgi:hypothetical protein
LSIFISPFSPLKLAFILIGFVELIFLKIRLFLEKYFFSTTFKSIISAFIFPEKSELNKLSKKVSDKAIQIKLTEVNNMLTPLGKLSKIDNDDLVNLLQYYALLEELVKANGQVQI